MYNEGSNKGFKTPFRFYREELEKCELKGCEDDDTAKLIFECS